MKVKTLELREAMIESKRIDIYIYDSWSLIIAESLKKNLIFFDCIIYILKKLTIIKKLFYHILRARKFLKINSSIQKISWENACVGGYTSVFSWDFFHLKSRDFSQRYPIRASWDFLMWNPMTIRAL